MIASYLALRTQIASWLNRSDFTTDQLKGFVGLVEDDIRNDVETRYQPTLATGTMTGDGFVAPAGYQSTRTLVVDGDLWEYVTPVQYAQYVSAELDGGFYTINGDTFSVLEGNGLAYELMYMRVHVALSADGDTNWILTNASNVYLWGGCKYAAVFLKDRESAEGFHALYTNAVNRLNHQERKAKSAGPLQVRVG